jgi:hypothetical protein
MGRVNNATRWFDFMNTLSTLGIVENIFYGVECTHAGIYEAVTMRYSWKDSD